MDNQTLESPLRKTWIRLKKNKPAIASLLVICIAIFLAIFASAIAPDKTPDADDQVLELTNLSPNTKVQMLLVRKNKAVAETNFLKSIFLGKENPYKNVPIKEMLLNDTSVVVKVFAGEDRPVETQIISLAQVVYAISNDKPEIKYQNNQAVFYDIDNQLQKISVKDLQLEIKKNHIVTKRYWLGTDGYGRDILSRLLLGVRVSLTVGFIAVLISLTIGIFMGSIAGYFRGWVDNVVMWLINVIWSIPTILLAMTIRFVIGDKINSFLAIFIAVGLSMWVDTARIVRGQVLSVREMDYIQAARSLGYNHFRTIFRHILPNIVGPILVIAAADFASAILIEAGLSFIGIGVKPPTPSWGTMLNDHLAYLTTDKAFLALAPGICIMILVLAFNLLGNGLRDAFDVKGQTV